MSLDPRSRKRISVYSGELARPIPTARRPPLAALTLTGQTIESWIKEQAINDTVKSLGKLLLLLEHFGIDKDDPDRWFFLAVRLAREHVPGFQLMAPRGRPQGRRVQSGDVYFEIERLRAKGQSVASACAILSKRSGAFLGAKASTLRRQYHEAAKPLRNLSDLVDKKLGPGTFAAIIRDVLSGN